LLQKQNEDFARDLQPITQKEHPVFELFVSLRQSHFHSKQKSLFVLQHAILPFSIQSSGIFHKLIPENQIPSYCKHERVRQSKALVSCHSCKSCQIIPTQNDIEPIFFQDGTNALSLGFWVLKIATLTRGEFLCLSCMFFVS